MTTTETLFDDLELPEKFILGAYLAGVEEEVQWVPRSHKSDGRLERIVAEMERLKRQYQDATAQPEPDEQHDPNGADGDAEKPAEPPCGWDCHPCHRAGHERGQMQAEIARLRAERDAWKKLTAEAWEAGAAWAASDPEWCRRKNAV